MVGPEEVTRFRVPSVAPAEAVAAVKVAEGTLPPLAAVLVVPAPVATR